MYDFHTGHAVVIKIFHMPALFLPCSFALQPILHYYGSEVSHDDCIFDCLQFHFGQHYLPDAFLFVVG